MVGVVEQNVRVLPAGTSVLVKRLNIRHLEIGYFKRQRRQMNGLYYVNVDSPKFAGNPES